MARKFSGIMIGRKVKELKADDPALTDREASQMVDGKIEHDDWLEWVEFAERNYHEPKPFRESAPATEQFTRSGKDAAAGDLFS